MQYPRISPLTIAWGVAGTLIALSFGFKWWLLVHPTDTRTVPLLGPLDSTHVHASLLIMNQQTPVFLCSPKYMLASQEVHFEDNNCSVVHVHATGVTLATFFDSIEVSLRDGCLSVPDMPVLCGTSDSQVRAVVNGVEVELSDLRYRVLENNDHILINYGPESGPALRFKYNQVPSIPITVNEPSAGQLY